MQSVLSSLFRFRRPTPVSYALAAIVAVFVAVGLWQTRAQEGVPLSELTRQTHLHGIAVDPNNSSVLILATHHGVWRLEGETARRISDNRDDYMGFTSHPSESDTFFASGHPETGGNLGFIVSRDGGRSWEQLSEGAAGPVDFHAMDVSAADPNVMYGLYGMVQRSLDGGESWQVRGEPPADLFALAASSVDADTVYAATRIGLMVSRDGGAIWEPLGGGGQPASLVESTPDGSLYAFVVGEGLLRAEEPRLEWQQLSNDFGDQVLLHLAVDPSDPMRLYAVSQHSAILVSADGGRSWRALGE